MWGGELRSGGLIPLSPARPLPVARQAVGTDVPPMPREVLSGWQPSSCIVGAQGAQAPGSAAPQDGLLPSGRASFSPEPLRPLTTCPLPSRGTAGPCSGPLPQVLICAPLGALWL